MMVWGLFSLESAANAAALAEAGQRAVVRVFEFKKRCRGEFSVCATGLVENSMRLEMLEKARM